MNRFIPLIILAFVVFIAYGQTLNMYFWHDDYSHLYLVQQNEPSPYPYYFNTLLVKSLWNLFKLNPKGYFAVGIILYLSATYLVFWLAKIIFQNRLIATSLGLVFASGYVGQDAMEMFLGDGIMVIVAMSLALLTIISFIKYQKTLKKNWFILSFIFFFLTLEVAPHRYAGLLIIMLGLDWLSSWNKKGGLYELFARNFLFLLVFLIQYVAHPVRLLFKYPLETFPVVKEFQIDYMINALGSFWSLIFPYEYQYRLYPKSFWMLTLALIVFYALVFLFIKLLRRRTSSFRVFIHLILILVVILLGGRLLHLVSKDPMIAVSATNGLSFLVFLLSLLSLKVPINRLMAIFSLILIFGSLSTFFVIKPELMLKSTNRYLMASALGLPFLCSFFLSEEFIKKKTRICTKKLATVIFLLPISSLIFLHLSAGISSQREFINNYSRHSRKIFSQLNGFIGQVNSKTVIFIDSVDNKLSYAVGDASRVGRYGSEVAFAVHYKTKKENILLPETLGVIPLMLKQDPELSPSDVYTFIYSEKGLTETSRKMRRLLESQAKNVFVSSNEMEGVSTLLPIRVKIKIKVRPEGVAGKFLNKEGGEVMVEWDYNIQRTILLERMTTLKVPLDGNWYTYEFVIPAGGEYLTGLRVVNNESFPVKVTYKNISYKYLYE